MDRESKNSAIAAACILIGFGVVGYYMPNIMLAAGAYSPIIGGIIAIAFVLAFFGIFWWRGKSREGK